MPVKEPPYDIGDNITITLTFRDKNDVLKDPTIALAKIYCPDKTVISPTLTRLSLGVYSFDYLIANGSGRYKVWGQGTGGVLDITTEPTHFDVRTPLS
jgi:hypothetical protein